jgi:hypothetical protein
MLLPTVSRAVYLGIRHPSGAYDQIFVTVRQLRVCWCGAISLTRGRVCRLQLLLALASAVIFGSESHGTRDFPFCRLLRLGGGIRPPLKVPPSDDFLCPFVTPRQGQRRKQPLYCWEGLFSEPLPGNELPIVARIRLRGNVFTETLRAMGL